MDICKKCSSPNFWENKQCCNCLAVNKFIYNSGGDCPGCSTRELCSGETYTTKCYYKKCGHSVCNLCSNNPCVLCPLETAEVEEVEEVEYDFLSDLDTGCYCIKEYSPDYMLDSENLRFLYTSLRGGYKHKELIELLVEYHKFMLLKAKDSVCQPSAVIGEIWRVHKSMGDYNQFCENVCGKFIPYSDDCLSGFSRTVELYNKYYNRILNVEIWSPICRVDDIDIRFKLPSGQIITLTLNPFDSSSDIRNRLETTGVNMKGLQIIHRSIPIEKKMGLVSVSAKDGDLVYIARNIGSINY